MVYFTPTDIQDNIYKAIDIAKIEPVLIKDNDTEIIAMVPIAYYNQIKERAKNIARMKEIMDLAGKEAQEKGLTEEILTEILNEK